MVLWWKITNFINSLQRNISTNLQLPHAYDNIQLVDEVHAQAGRVHPELQLILDVHDATVSAQARGGEGRDGEGHPFPVVRGAGLDGPVLQGGHDTALMSAAGIGGEWVKFSEKIKKGGVIIPDDNIKW
jgi:hypothetical protein